MLTPDEDRGAAAPEIGPASPSIDPGSPEARAEAPSGPLEPDLELRILGAALEAVWAQERALIDRWLGKGSKDLDRAMELSHAIASPIAARIGALRATTMDGLIVKARALAWARGDERDEMDLGGGTTDLAIAGSIARDLLAMRGQ